MAVNSKQKGARFERLLASRLREHGYDTRRTAQYCGNTGDAADVVGLPGIHIDKVKDISLICVVECNWNHWLSSPEKFDS